MILEMIQEDKKPPNERRFFVLNTALSRYAMTIQKLRSKMHIREVLHYHIRIC